MYTSSILISFPDLGPPLARVHLERPNFQSRADWARLISTRWRHSVLAGPYLPTWLALLRRSANRKMGHEIEPLRTQGAALTFSDSATDGRHPRQCQGEFPGR